MQMKKQTKKLCFLTAAVMTMAAISCGCGKTDSETVEEMSTSSAEVTANPNTKESGDVTLRLWAGEEDKEFLAVVAENFIKEHASEANITIEHEPMIEGECRKNLLKDVLNAPDVYTTTDGDIRAIVSGGAASPVVHQDAVASANLEASVDAMTINGKLYGYPITADNGYFLYYNKAYFSESDIQSLDTMLAIAAENGKKFMMDWSSGWYLYAFYGQTGLKLGLNDDGVTNFCDWNSTSNAIKGVDVADALMTIAANPGFAASPDWLDGIASGDVIACVSGVWDEAAIKNMWGSDYAAAKLPKYTCAGQQVQMSCYFGYKMMGVNPYSKHVAWAHELAEYISNEENQKLRFKMRGQGPSNLNAAESPEVQKAVAVQAVLAQSEFSELQRLGGNFWNPSTELGNTLAAGNPEGLDMQTYLDGIVEKIISSTVQ